MDKGFRSTAKEIRLEPLEASSGAPQDGKFALRFFEMFNERSGGVFVFQCRGDWGGLKEMRGGVFDGTELAVEDFVVLLFFFSG